MTAILRTLKSSGLCLLGAACLLACGPLVTSGAVHASEVGVATAVNSDAFGTPPGGIRNTKIIGQNVLYNERIETSTTGLVQVLFLDGSRFTIGANSDLVIDEFVYDPDAGTGQLVATLGKGVARFVGGKLSKKRGGVTVNTPVGTIGIRGGIANINLEGETPVLSLLFGEELTFTGENGRKRRIYKAGYSMDMGGGGQSRIRRLSQGDLGSVQSGFAPGSRTQSGGIRTPPTDSQMSKSGIGTANSGLGINGVFPNGQRAPGAGGLQAFGRRLPDVNRASQQRLRDKTKQQTSVLNNDNSTNTVVVTPTVTETYVPETGAETYAPE